jgi:hypothetical protein
LRARALALQSFDAAPRSFLQRILKRATVVETVLNFRHQFGRRHAERYAAPSNGHGLGLGRQKESMTSNGVDQPPKRRLDGLF